MATIERPDIVTEEHLSYLGDLRERGVTNMFGARPHLEREFGCGKKNAQAILVYWMQSFSERRAVKKGQSQ